MKKISIPFNKPYIVGHELDYIKQAVLENAKLSGDGPFTAKCHAWLEKRLGCERALLTHSCTAALEMAAILADIKPGDEIIMPSFTFVSTANAFVLRGGVPVFVDIEPDTLNIDVSLIDNAINPKTRAIVPVHYAGVSCDMDAINEIAARHGLLVIEDAAQALFSTYKDRSLGTIGDFGCLSFHETKNIISGEGGALLINNPEYIERAEIIRQKGTNRNAFIRGEVDKYTWTDIGSSFLPGELIAAFLFAQLEKAEHIIDKRKTVFDEYMTALTPLADSHYIQTPCIGKECRTNGHIFYILCASNRERDRLMDELKRQEILSVFHYIPLHSSPAGKKHARIGSAMTVTGDIAGRIVRLPLYYEMTVEEIHCVTDCIINFYSN